MICGFTISMFGSTSAISVCSLFFFPDASVCACCTASFTLSLRFSMELKLANPHEPLTHALTAPPRPLLILMSSRDFPR